MTSTASPFFQTIRESFLTLPTHRQLSSDGRTRTSSTSTSVPSSSAVSTLNARLAALKEERCRKATADASRYSSPHNYSSAAAGSRNNSRERAVAAASSAGHLHDTSAAEGVERSGSGRGSGRRLNTESETDPFSFEQRLVRPSWAAAAGDGYEDDDEPPFHVHHGGMRGASSSSPPRTAQYPTVVAATREPSPNASSAHVAVATNADGSTNMRADGYQHSSLTHINIARGGSYGREQHSLHEHISQRFFPEKEHPHDLDHERNTDQHHQHHHHHDSPDAAQHRSGANGYSHTSSPSSSPRRNSYQQPRDASRDDDDDILTEEELACLRVVEIEQHVRVSAQLPHSTARARHNRLYNNGGANTAERGQRGGYDEEEEYEEESDGQTLNKQQQYELTVIGEDCVVTIYPRHVVLTRASGSPLVEFVIAELTEITEREELHALDFFLRQRDGVSTTIRVQCPHEPSRAAIYKIICAKRTQLARENSGKTVGGRSKI